LSLQHSWIGGVDGYAADLTAVSSGFIARLDFGELAQWGHTYRK
jgi:hypothetical protein